MLLLAVVCAPALAFGGFSLWGAGFLAILLVHGAVRATRGSQHDLSPLGGALLLLGGAVVDIFTTGHAGEQLIWLERQPVLLLWLGLFATAGLPYWLGQAWTAQRDPLPTTGRPSHRAPLLFLAVAAALATLAARAPAPPPPLLVVVLSVPLVARRCGGGRRPQRWLPAAPPEPSLKSWSEATLQRNAYLLLGALAAGLLMLAMPVAAACARRPQWSMTPTPWLLISLAGSAGLWALAAGAGLARRALWVLRAPGATLVADSAELLHARMPGQSEPLRLAPAHVTGSQDDRRLTLIGLSSLPTTVIDGYRQVEPPLAVPLVYSGDRGLVAASFLSEARRMLLIGVLSTVVAESAVALCLR